MPQPAARRAPALRCVEREMAGRPASPAGGLGVGEEAADVIPRAEVGGAPRARVLTDGRCVDFDGLADTGQLERADVRWQGSPPSAGRAAGTRLSRISAVLPAPEGPDSAESPPIGKRAVTSRRLKSSVTAMTISPADAGGAPRSRTTVARPDKNGPMTERGSDCSRSGGPWATIVPPSSPAQGPSSMIQSELRMSAMSCSTKTTELPLATRSAIVERRPSRFEGQADRGLV